MNNATLYYIQDITEAALGITFMTTVMVYYIMLKDASLRSCICLPSWYVMELKRYTFKQPQRKIQIYRYTSYNVILFLLIMYNYIKQLGFMYLFLIRVYIQKTNFVSMK